MTGRAAHRGRWAAATAGLAVVGAVWVAGSGDGSGGGRDDVRPGTAPATASTEDFCSAFAALARSSGKLIEAAPDASVATVRDDARAVGDIAARVPDLPAEARAGLTYVVDALRGLPDDATPADVDAADDGASVADDVRADALIAFVGTSCPPN